MDVVVGASTLAVVGAAALTVLSVVGDVTVADSVEEPQEATTTTTGIIAAAARTKRLIGDIASGYGRLLRFLGIYDNLKP